MSTVHKQPVSMREDAPAPFAKSCRSLAATPRQQALALEELRAEPERSRTLPQPVTGRERERLWFCIHLPKLPLEACESGSEARAVVEERHGLHRVLLADGRAEAAGVMPGQSVNAALALLPTLEVVERSGLAEQQALETLAAWLGRFTPLVCLAGPDILLLEIAGSRRLYEGLKNLRRRIAEGLRQRGFTASSAIAPTPLAATWLARGGRRVCIREPANLTTVLRALPLFSLGWSAAVCESLSGMGVRSLGDCLRLPREGFARRFGPACLLEIDRALGRLPDPRNAWRAPERFRADYELDNEQSDRESLLALCGDLLSAHERFLMARQLGTQRIRFSFFHLRGAATHLSLGCVEAERLADRWCDLLRIRFERLTLPEPVIAVRLQGGPTMSLRTASGRLRLSGRAGTAEPRYPIAQLAGRLAARVGWSSVAGVMLVAEHRPQLAWRWRDPNGDEASGGPVTGGHELRRPLWMLPEPAALEAGGGIPHYRGRLTLLEGPERLETGWWDTDGIARDYYLAVNPHGMRLWVFRNRRRETVGWYLHGFFG
jgi:protein ImuB